MPAHPVARNRITDYGLDELCDQVASGRSLTNLALEIGVSAGTLVTWIAADPERSARINFARRNAARVWDEKAEQVLTEAETAVDVQRARELAQHYRWRAKMANPGDYGDRVDVNHTGQLEVRQVDEDELRARLTGLLSIGSAPQITIPGTAELPADPEPDAE